MRNVMRYISHVGFCPKVGCQEIVSPHPRKTQTEAKRDLTEHRRAGHPPIESRL